MSFWVLNMRLTRCRTPLGWKLCLYCLNSPASSQTPWHSKHFSYQMLYSSISSIRIILAPQRGQQISSLILFSSEPISGSPISRLSEPLIFLSISASRESNQMPLQLTQRSTSMSWQVTGSNFPLHFGQLSVGQLISFTLSHKNLLYII